MSNNFIKVVLIEPNGPINVGSIARICANFGVNDLRLVRPKCNLSDPIAKRMAVKGLTVLNNAKCFQKTIDAISDCSKIIATCGRIDHGDIPLENINNVYSWALENGINSNIAILFGREDHGLSNNELLYANKVVSLRTSKEYPSLNLSHAVSIIIHSLNEYKINKESSRVKNFNKILANPREIYFFLKETKKLLLDVGFLMKHTSNAKMNKIKMLINRSEITSNELSLLRGMIKQINWSLINKDIKTK